MTSKDKKEIVENISSSRREFVRKAVKAGYAVPIVATFTMTGLMSNPAAAASNQSV